jgi:hypothetical protein
MMKLKIQPYSLLWTIILLYHVHVSSAELLTLSAQLDHFAHTAVEPSRIIPPEIPVSRTAPVNILDFSQHPCIIRTRNTLAPPKPIEFKTKQNISVKVIQPFVTWQDLSCASFTKPDQETKQFAELDGYTTQAQIDFFFQELKKNNITGKAEQERLKLHSQETSCRLGGGDASCGYHAIAHLETVVAAITGEGSKYLANLLNLQRINKHFGFENVRRIWNPEARGNGDWRETIINAQKNILSTQEDKKTKQARELIASYLQLPVFALSFARLANAADGEWLDVNGIQFLLKDLKKSAEYLPSNVAWHIQHASPEELAQVLKEKFQEKSQVSFIVACICHGESTDPQQNTSHWFGVVVSSSKDQMQIIILDSKNKPRFGHSNVLKIIRDATGTSITELKSEFSLSGPAQQTHAQTSLQTARQDLIFSLLPDTPPSEIEKIFQQAGTPLTAQEKKLYFGTVSPPAKKTPLLPQRLPVKKTPTPSQ